MPRNLEDLVETLGRDLGSRPSIRSPNRLRNTTPRNRCSMANSTPLGASGPQPSSPSESLWILGPFWDLILFVATPLLILPAMALARSQFRIEEIALFVASFGALGHHLPGMLRAYGDRALFERFKLRFIVAPVFLTVVCVTFTISDLSAIVLAVYAWGVWHGMMQTYGFLRIYDAKVKSFAKITSKIDWWLCATWFGSAVLLSETRMANVLGTFYRAGGPQIPPTVVAGARTVALGALVAVTTLFVLNTLRQWKAGTPPNPIKLMLMVTSFGFWWYSNVLVGNMLVGIALFEIFHDVQYLSIVWLYNQKRADSAGDQLSSFARFLFRRSGALAGLYVGLVFAYGSLNYVAQGLGDLEALKRVLMGLLLASALLHFYYDGFIWKVREKSTRESLGLEGGTQTKAPGWLTHGLRWSLFVLPLAIFGVIEVRGASMADLDRAQAVSAALPEFAEGHYNLGAELASAGRTGEAFAAYRRALELDPEMAAAHVNLGNLAFEHGHQGEAVEHFREALRLDPADSETRGALGKALLFDGDVEGAVAELETALETRRDDASLHTQLGNALAARGDAEGALARHRLAVATEPGSAEAHYNLALVLGLAGDGDGAVASYRKAIEVDPDHSLARFNLGNALAREGRHDAAVEQYKEALRIAADADTHYNLGNSLAALDRPAEAADAFRAALDLRPRFPQALHNLAAATQTLGNTEQAVVLMRRAVDMEPSYAEAHYNLGRLLEHLGRSEEAALHLATALQLGAGG